MKFISVFKSLLLLAICYSNSTKLFAVDVTSLTVDVPVAGTLSSKLGVDKDSIRNLTISGYINGTDVNTLMNMKSLINLDILNANIVNGGEPYFCITHMHSNYCHGTQDNIIGRYMFVYFGNLQSIITPKSATLIGDGTFNKLKRLKSVVISNNVTTIESGAFFECSALSSLQMGNNVTSIGYNAFYGCTSLKSITLPAGIEEIGSGAYYGCSELTEIHCKMKTLPTIKPEDFSYIMDPFANIDKTNCLLYVPKGTYQMYRSAKYWGGFEFIIEEETSVDSNVQENNVSVYSDNNFIIVKGANIGDEISLYSISGLLLLNAKISQELFKITVNTDNMYLVKIGKRTYKVAL